MAEDSDLERTEQATGRRIQQARDKGQIPRSRELSTFLVLMVGGAALAVMSSHLMASMTGMLKHGLKLDRAAAFDPTAMATRLHDLSLDVLIAFLPFLGVMMVAAVLSTALLGGWNFTTEPLTPTLNKLNPLKGLARLFGWSSLVEMFKAVFKAILVAGGACWIIWSEKEAFFALSGQSLTDALAHTGHLVLFTFLAVTATLLLLVLIDVPWQLWEYQKNLRMTKEEVKQEHKETEGSPEVKARVRQIQREQARRRMMAQVPKADVIVTNPTRYAVALKYDERKMKAPRIVAKGSYLLAERIRELAAEHKVPILQAPPLARALYHHAEVGDEIPARLYTAVAEVLAYVYQLRRFNLWGGVAPKPPGDIGVPSDLDPEAGMQGASA